MEETLAPARGLFSLNIQTTNYAVTVKIINTTTYIKGPGIANLLYPHIKGHDTYRGPSYAFLIEHELKGSTRRLLFDLGMRKDWHKLSPVIVSSIEAQNWSIHVENSVAEVLEDGGVNRADIEAIIWSHWHWDHTGDPSEFPASVKLIVGPGFKDFILPGWPAATQGLILQSDYTGRKLEEIDFSRGEQRVKIGRFDACDYFGDGSFFILDAPGHAVGHLCALARVTISPSSFIFLGADACHHSGEFRPTEYLPLPKYVIPNPLNPRGHGAWPGRRTLCPGSLFRHIHPKQSATEPFYHSPPDDQVTHDKAVSVETIQKVKEFDASGNTFVCMAHDESLLDVLDFFPQNINDWMQKGWADEVRWAFLNDFKEAVKNNV